ncbi:MAG TPA: sensor domain-containing diguanylate cyclase [Candidatus Tumulicola sp.]|nr:sensor domain-containing diguanylate cyclase [Candidatus Tumulicola sp.]
MRWLAIVQALIAPLGDALPYWMYPSLVGYGLLTSGIALGPKVFNRAPDRSEDLSKTTLLLLVLLDIAAAIAVAYYSGFSALIMLAGLDAAALPVVTALLALLFAAMAIAAMMLFARSTDLASALMFPLCTSLLTYVGAAYGLYGRRRADYQIIAINKVLEAGSDLGVKVTMPEVLTQLVQMIRQFRESVPWSNVVVFIARFDEDAKEEMLHAEAVDGVYADYYRGASLRFGEGVIGHAAMEQRPIIVADLQKDYRETHVTKPRAVHGCLAVPIVSERVTIGCIALTSTKAGIYGFDHQRLIDRLVRLAAVGIQNARLHTKTLELAETDSMTGLLTNRAYQERLETEFRCARTTRQSLSLLILDVDFFKRVNDTYGHPQGDDLLRKVGEVIRQHARKVDICCRYGGDEFVVLMPGTIKAEAAMVASRMREAIEDMDFALGEKVAKITASIGVAGYPQDVSEKAALVQAADSAMYAAKRSGRNNVKLAGRTDMVLPVRT